jgi:methionyl-tRNA synthetase
MGEDDTIPYEDFAKLDLVVAEVIAARAHPNADRLLLLEIDVGDGKRQIVAGIRGHYDPETLAGRRIIVLKNLAPRKVRGEPSQGMLLAASAGERIVLLQPDSDVPAGSQVS